MIVFAWSIPCDQEKRNLQVWTTADESYQQTNYLAVSTRLTLFPTSQQTSSQSFSQKCKWQVTAKHMCPMHVASDKMTLQTGA